MLIEETNSRGKYTCYLLRDSYREGSKVKHRTIANLSACSEDDINAMRLALKHKKDLAALIAACPDVTLRQGLSVGAVWLVYDLARQLGIADALPVTFWDWMRRLMKMIYTRILTGSIRVRPRLKIVCSRGLGRIERPVCICTM